jgi:hypothetical protein
VAAIGKYKMNDRGYDWVKIGVASAGFALLNLDGGRMSGICLIDENTRVGNPD